MVTAQGVIAANRFGLGARPGDLADIGEDHREWLRAQLVGKADIGSGANLNSADILREFQRLQRARNEARRSDNEEAGDTAQREFGAYVRTQYRLQTERRYALAAVTDSPFRERLVHFWTNHFAVSADKQAVTPLVGTLEEEAIRPQVTGRFVDMLVAVAQHPAMILYLDNQASMGPNSRAARAASRRGRALGLNENLAREILELHTLGVGGGYSQADVTSFANVITGWSIGGGNESGGTGQAGTFFFRAGTHEPGAKTVLNKRYREAGIAEGEAVLADLARHPSTAQFLALKLARHFVADEPPQALVSELARVYQSSDGDLTAVYEALIDANSSWQEALSKYKTPHDFLISTNRAFNYQPVNPRRMLTFLEFLGQRSYTPRSPAGWPDTMEHWDGGDGLLKRIEWADAVAAQTGDRVNPAELAEEILGPALGDHTRTAISRAESAAQGVTLLLASPEFQRR
jgi:uncharacterized protein (DUF1800 family)